MAYLRSNSRRLGSARFAKKINKGLHSKWYVDATIPRGVPIVGGGGIRFGSGNQPVRRMQSKTVQSVIRQGIRSIEPLKYNTLSDTTQALQSTHFYVFNPLANIPVGSGETARVSTDIFVKKIQIKGWLKSLQTNGTGVNNNPVHLRVMWIRMTKKTGSGGVIFSADTITPAEMFLPGQTQVGSNLIHMLDPDKVTIIADDIYTLTQGGVALAYQSKVLDISCPLENFPFRFGGPVGDVDANYSNHNKNIYCILSVNCANTLTTDTVANFTWDYACSFTDSR